MAFTDHKLKFQIDADSTGAKRELAEVDGLIGRLGAGVGSLAAPAAIAAAGFVAVGAAAVSASVALFNLTKTAADYGSTIFDASKKTGLAAETLSAMDFAARQSGASLEQITGGVSKFAKTVGEAADGSDKAAAKLKDLGITPQEALSDLDGALGKVFQKIADASPGIERITLAQKAFGKSGADLLPFIDSFNGDLTELIENAKELGVTIDDEAARAADEFGDQLDTLNDQFAGIGRTIGGELMPVFLDLARGLSHFLAENNDAIRNFGTNAADVIRGVIVTMQNFDAATEQATNSSVAAWANWAIRVQSSIDPVARTLITLINRMREAGAASRGLEGAGRAAGGYIGMSVAGYQGGGGYKGGGGGGGGGKSSAASDAEKAKREAERKQKEYEAQVKKAAQEAIKDERQTMAERLALHTAEYERMYSVSLKYAADEKRTAEDLARYEEYLGEQTLEHKKDLLLEYIVFLKEAGPEAVDELRGAEHSLLILEKQIETNRNTNAANEHKRKEKEIADEKELRNEKLQSWNSYLERMKAVADAEFEADQREAERNRRAYESGTVMGGTGIGGAIGQGMGIQLPSIFDDATNAMVTFDEYLARVGANINDFVGQSIGGLIQGLTAMGVAWLTTGEFSAQAALQMVAGAALGIAIEAGFKGLFELAEAAAAAARLDPWGAAAHTAAAGLFFGVAATAGAIGVGAGLGARAMGGGGGAGAGGGSGSYSGGGRASDRDQRPISRVTDDAYISGRRTDPATLALARSVEKLEKKLDSMRSGDVLIAGMRQKPGAVADQFTKDVARNSALGSKAARSIGLK